MKFSFEEISFLKQRVPYLPDAYFEFLETFKLDPKSEVCVNLEEDGNLDIHIKGPWVVTILYEIPILALVSEGYFEFVDTDWTYDGQLEKAEHKGKSLLSRGCIFSEFGTRRRRSFKTQDTVIDGLVRAATLPDGKGLNPAFLGTSNVLLAQKYDLQPIGTVAHEWMMGIAAYTQDYTNANKVSMQYWLDVMGKDAAGFALTDTFGTDDFLKSFVPPFTDAYKGVRQDSGDPSEYTRHIAAHFKKLGYAPNTKAIIYSDSLDIEKCVKYKREAEENGLNAFFGVGTFLTSKFQYYLFSILFYHLLTL